MIGTIIKQEDTFGCSVACVANLLNTTYIQARELFEGGQPQAEVKGFLCQEIVDALAKAGVDSYYERLDSKSRRKIYKENTIVCIQKNNRFPYGHYLLRSGNGWLDSWNNYPEDKDLKNAKSAFRRRLPGKPTYAIFVNNKEK